jgi:citronellol/citronellal dehydrogenase
MSSKPTLKGKTLFITGASRGIGKAIALRAAADGANVVVAAKTAECDPRLPGTIYATAEEVEAAGGAALAVPVDVRDERQIADGVEQAVGRFGGIDILVNNASAISLTDTAGTSPKRFDLMFDVNVRGSFVCSRTCLSHLLKAPNPHILNLAPPLSMKKRWFKAHSPYTVSKYAMSLWVLGMAAELRAAGVAVNALWPRTVIDTAALRLLGDRVNPENCRKSSIVADAAHAILSRSGRRCTGNFFIDEEVLAAEGVMDLERYAVAPGKPLQADLFID